MRPSAATCVDHKAQGSAQLTTPTGLSTPYGKLRDPLCPESSDMNRIASVDRGIYHYMVIKIVHHNDILY